MKKSKTVLILLLTAALLCAGVCCAETRVNLADYLSVVYTGTNGRGVARADFDFSGFERDIMSGWQDGDQLQMLADLTAVEMSILPEPARAENLSNGDTFTVRIGFDEQLAKAKGYAFSGLEKTFTVEGLGDAVAIDPFAPEIFGEGRAVNVFVEGVDPFLMLNIWNEADFNDPVYHIRYRADKDFAFRNNEMITITAELDAPYAKQGYVLSRTETVISFDGLPRYAAAAEDLPEETLRSIALRAYQECLNGGNANIMDISGSYSPWAVEFSEIRVGEHALLAVNNMPEMEYSFLLVPVYKTISTDEWYDMEAGVNTSMRWEDVIGYYKFTDLILQGDGSVSYNESYVEMNGNFASRAAADALYLDQYRANYTFTEIPMPRMETA